MPTPKPMDDRRSASASAAANRASDDWTMSTNCWWTTVTSASRTAAGGVVPGLAPRLGLHEPAGQVDGVGGDAQPHRGPQEVGHGQHGAGRDVGVGLVEHVAGVAGGPQDEARCCRCRGTPGRSTRRPARARGRAGGTGRSPGRSRGCRPSAGPSPARRRRRRRRRSPEPASRPGSGRRSPRGRRCWSARRRRCPTSVVAEASRYWCSASSRR